MWILRKNKTAAVNSEQVMYFGISRNNNSECAIYAAVPDGSTVTLTDYVPEEKAKELLERIFSAIVLGVSCVNMEE